VTLSVLASGRELSPHEVRALPRSSQHRCWKGTTLPVPFSWSVAIDPRCLWFVCALPGGDVCASKKPQGSFVEGLWNGDVAELFIKGDDGRYQELNVAPSGAWWSMTLSEYRKREPEAKRPELVHTSCALEAGRWEVVAAFERQSLQVDVNPSSSIHVAGMWYRPESTFLSSHPPPGIEPDYHDHGCFQPISLTSIRG
jgi:hypothetical protein